MISNKFIVEKKTFKIPLDKRAQATMALKPMDRVIRKWKWTQKMDFGPTNLSKKDCIGHSFLYLFNYPLEKKINDICMVYVASSCSRS